MEHVLNFLFRRGFDCVMIGRERGQGMEEPLVELLTERLAECAICYDLLEEGTAAASHSCSTCKEHLTVHETCLQRWLQIKSSCPRCRTPIEEHEDKMDVDDTETEGEAHEGEWVPWYFHSQATSAVAYTWRTQR